MKNQGFHPQKHGFEVAKARLGFRWPKPGFIFQCFWVPKKGRSFHSALGDIEKTPGEVVRFSLASEDERHSAPQLRSALCDLR